MDSAETSARWDENHLSVGILVRLVLDILRYPWLEKEWIGIWYGIFAISGVNARASLWNERGLYVCVINVDLNIYIYIYRDIWY